MKSKRKAFSKEGDSRVCRYIRRVKGGSDSAKGSALVREGGHRCTVFNLERCGGGMNGGRPGKKGPFKKRGDRLLKEKRFRSKSSFLGAQVLENRLDA